MEKELDETWTTSNYILRCYSERTDWLKFLLLWFWLVQAHSLSAGHRCVCIDHGFREEEIKSNLDFEFKWFHQFSFVSQEEKNAQNAALNWRKKLYDRRSIACSIVHVLPLAVQIGALLSLVLLVFAKRFRLTQYLANPGESRTKFLLPVQVVMRWNHGWGDISLS